MWELWERWHAGIRSGDDRALDALRRLMVSIATVEDRPTAGELEVLKRFALGDTYRQAADHLFLSPEGVKSRIELARRKLGARNTTHAVVLAYKQGLLA